jgi:hypothetical protein
VQHGETLLVSSVWLFHHDSFEKDYAEISEERVNEGEQTVSKHKEEERNDGLLLSSVCILPTTQTGE